MLLKKLGKYEIVDWLGGGRFGDVFLARDTILEKEFALKISRMRREEITILKDEARLLSSLNHPNIVRFYNIDFIENKFVLVMEYIKGRTLRDLIVLRGIDTNEAINITGQILDALIYAHKNGVLHRDLKPENILITEEETRLLAKITDFGLARFIKADSISASSAGTPIYMAPEAWAGTFHARSDIWSIGIMLYELLTGVPPFLDDNLDGLRKKIEKNKYLAPTMRRTDIPEYVEDAIVKCLKVNPDARPAASELLDRLMRKGKGIKIKVGFIAPQKQTQELTLTPTQQDVVSALDGKILLLGQAGCGKTTTLSYAVARLIDRGTPASRILVGTFTNKAANDIRESLQKLTNVAIHDLWIGTLHTIGLRILRRNAERIDLSEDFTIQEPKQIFETMKVSTGKYRSNAIIKYIEVLKAKAISATNFKPKNDWERLCHKIYQHYEEFKKENNLLDYDDLVLCVVKMLQDNRDLQEYYQNLFDYIFIDELQDINPAQYQMVKLILKSNIFLTGDEDQAIYGWRGAERELIYHVGKDLKDIKTYYLTKSFRLPQGILELANNLMLRSATAIPTGDVGDVFVYGAKSEQDEADYLVKEIKALKKENLSFHAIAVLYRMNSLSRIYEETLARNHIPHTIIGGLSFYERAEVKPLIEYLELLDSSEKPSQEFLAQAFSLFKIKDKNLPRAREILPHHQQHARLLSPAKIIEEIVDISELKGENIEEIKVLAHNSRDTTLTKFLSEIKLVQELDLVDWGKDTVKLMTVHSAKGLEFPVVFIVDLVEDTFPLIKKMSAQKELDEERRLCYVAVTRAKKKLYLLYPKWRYGRYQKPSRFLVDMFKTTPNNITT